ncbi:glycosyltransferase family 2 protein [Akkermansiaceae bacterium]|nr:glycosyltransferase family 2 protein [Akkermansiaceae bacterium]MDB4586229.1 glycosyltransferase family 2 protein [Akkermansiaceae bacterium]MDB4625969.1 glycosyltransferase family 2 protein [Akkermansiaceae bacterium]
MNKKLSVIVPVFNVESWLNQCVDSLLAQTYPHIQIILVNDGSTDSSGHICDEYGALHDKVVVVHCRNGGQSAARNEGLNHVDGDYIGFVDSDDYVVPEYAETVILAMEEEPTDLLIFAVLRLRNGLLSPWMQPVPSHGGSITTLLSETLCGRQLNISPVNKCYTRRLFDTLRFREGIKFEDAYMTPDLFYLCETVRYIDNSLYVYRDNPQSTMNLAAVRGNRDALTVATYVIDRLKDLYGGEYQRENLWWCVRRVLRWVYRIHEAGTVKENAEFLGEVREFLKVHIFRTKETLPHMRDRDRFLVSMFIRHPHIFGVAVISRRRLMLLKRRCRAVIQK